MVAIKDFKMPENCYECELHNYHFCDITGSEIEEEWDNGLKANNCPLVEIKENENGNDD